MRTVFAIILTVLILFPGLMVAMGKRIPQLRKRPSAVLIALWCVAVVAVAFFWVESFLFPGPN